ncbi:MAG: ribosome-associated translation inhibitor RaiA [bacterium]
MKYSLTTKNIQLPEADIKLLDKKLERLEKHLRPPFQTDVVLRHDRHHRTGDTVTCIVNIKQRGSVFHAQRVGKSAQEALDEVIAALKKELVKNREKRRGS